MQENANESMQRGLRVRAEVQVAQIARLRPGQRLQGYIHGLVPVPFLLRMSMRSRQQQQVPLIWWQKLIQKLTQRLTGYVTLARKLRQFVRSQPV